MKEEDFVKMQQYGVRLVRVPTGYWNWVDLGDATPNAPDNVAWRLRNLQSVSAGQYSQYLDRIFQWAARQGSIFCQKYLESPNIKIC